MQVPKMLKDVLFPTRGDLRKLHFTEAGRDLEALVPDDELFSLTREMLLQRVYDVPGAPFGTAIDAGAHVGLFSIILAQHAERVIALEPSLFNYGVLRLNLESNAIHNVTALNAALWIEDGSVSFSESEHHSTGGQVAASGAREVAARSLDSLIDEYGEIDLLKIDIEGAEVDVIPAAKKLGQVTQIVGELHRSEDADSLPVEHALRDAGFAVEIIPASSLYEPHHALEMLRRFGRLEGHGKVKVGAVAYALAPITKPRRAGRDLPLFVARRSD